MGDLTVSAEAVQRVIEFDATQRGTYGVAVRDVLLHLGLIDRETAAAITDRIGVPADPRPTYLFVCTPDRTVTSTHAIAQDGTLDPPVTVEKGTTAWVGIGRETPESVLVPIGGAVTLTRATVLPGMMGL